MKRILFFAVLFTITLASFSQPTPNVRKHYKEEVIPANAKIFDFKDTKENSFLEQTAFTWSLIGMDSKENAISMMTDLEKKLVEFGAKFELTSFSKEDTKINVKFSKPVNIEALLAAIKEGGFTHSKVGARVKSI